MSTRANSLETEKILYRYSSALERGDFATVAAVLELAQADAELEGLLIELNQAYASASVPGPEPGEAREAAGRSAGRGGEGLGRFFKPRWWRERQPAASDQPAATRQPAASPRPWAVVGVGALVVLLVAFGIFNMAAGLSGAGQNRGLRGLLLEAGSHGAPQAMAPTVAPPVLQVSLATATPAPTEAAAPTEAPAATQAPAIVPGLPYPAPGAGGKGLPAQPYPVPQAAIPSGSEHLIVRNGALTLVVSDTRKARDAIQGLVAGMAGEGAFVVSSNEMNAGDASQPVIQMELRVPAAHFEAVMEALAGLALRVDGRSESAQDVTAEFVDLGAQLEQLKAARQRLLEIMKSASNAEDLLRAEDLLTQRETEIASIEGRMKYMQQTAQLSSIQVTLNPSVLSQPIQPAGWNPAETARLAVGRLVGGVQAFTDWLINFAIATLPWLVVLGLAAWGAWRLAARRKAA